MEANEGPVALRIEVTIFVNFRREPGHENYCPAVVRRASTAGRCSSFQTRLLVETCTRAWTATTPHFLHSLLLFFLNVIKLLLLIFVQIGTNLL